MVRRVLVVDDDDAIRELCGALLRDEGYEVSYAANGAEGLQALTDDLHLVVLDIRMPVMDGLEFLRRLRARAAYPEVLVVSAALDLTSVRDREVVSVLAKPFTADEFVGAVHALVPANGA